MSVLCDVEERILHPLVLLRERGEKKMSSNGGDFVEDRVRLLLIRFIAIDQAPFLLITKSLSGLGLATFAGAGPILLEHSF